LRRVRPVPCACHLSYGKDVRQIVPPHPPDPIMGGPQCRSRREARTLRLTTTPDRRRNLKTLDTYRPNREGTGAAMTPDTMFWIASMTKAVTSVAAMQMVEQGKLSLDKPISRGRTRGTRRAAGKAACRASAQGTLRGTHAPRGRDEAQATVAQPNSPRSQCRGFSLSRNIGNAHVSIQCSSACSPFPLRLFRSLTPDTCGQCHDFARSFRTGEAS
jgi:Beta-lactamase